MTSKRTYPNGQCPAVGLWDGANCCALREGHDGPHENAFGSRMEGCRWTLDHDEHARYMASLYYQERGDDE